MPFDRELVEAQLALQRIGTTDMPKLAWDALEAGLDGPATRRLAALHSPTFFEVREILPRLLLEWGMAQVPREQAAPAKFCKAIAIRCCMPAISTRCGSKPAIATNSLNMGRSRSWFTSLNVRARLTIRSANGSLKN
jgi:hypothetical protein